MTRPNTAVCASALAALLLTACTTPPAAAPLPPAPPAAGAEDAAAILPEPYIGRIEIIRGETPDAAMISGVVFEDLNRDSRRQPDEPGIAGVLVSNGVEIVRTDETGGWRLPVRPDMSVSVVQPSGWRTPVNENWIPQFAYEHKPAGSPKTLRFGGLPPTGPVPAAINFPLVRAAASEAVSCAIIGDSQTYNNIEVGYFRDSVVNDVVSQNVRLDCAVFVGDVVGDDLDLIPRLQAVGSVMRTPQYYVHGNHDFDFDADHDADSADSWRRLFGPAYYAFEIGNALFIVLDNVVYPCGAEDAERPGREFCLSEERKMYNGRVTDEQMTWLAALLAETPASRKIVYLHHIPFVSFVDHTSPQHQTDNLAAIYALTDDRPAISFSGHTHTLEYFEPGDSFPGWKEAVDVDALPFRHIVAGAAAGGWWNGDFDMDGVPMSLSRLGEPRGYIIARFSEQRAELAFVPLGTGRDRQMALSLNTPPFRDWFEAIMAWRAEPAEERDPVPPFSINDLPDVKMLTPEDLEGGVHLTANVWAGSTATSVTVSLNDGPAQPMRRTQDARGEDPRIGAAFADPYAAMRQLSVARVALQSRSGNPDAQGQVSGRRTASGPRPPQPGGPVADRSMSLWQFTLPASLAPGMHVATVETRLDGRRVTDRLVFEIVPERPRPDWRADVWDAFDNGPPVR